MACKAVMNSVVLAAASACEPSPPTVIVVGGGVAGLSAAIEAAPAGRVVLLEADPAHLGGSAWWGQAANSDWWRSDERLAESVGYWREIFNMPVDHLETLHSTETPYGVGTLTEEVEGPIIEHGYPGGMRDRIALSAEDDLRA